MPIHPDYCHLYPPHWRELANPIKFERARGRCERCGRPHGQVVLVIAAGGWLDPETGEGYDDQGQSLGCCRSSDGPEGRFVKTILTCAHLDQNPAHNARIWRRCARVVICGTTSDSTSKAPTGTDANAGPLRTCSTESILEGSRWIPVSSLCYATSSSKGSVALISFERDLATLAGF